MNLKDFIVGIEVGALAMGLLSLFVTWLHYKLILK